MKILLLFRNPQDFFLKYFFVNFSTSTVWKTLLFVNASAYYLYSSDGRVDKDEKDNKDDFVKRPALAGAGSLDSIVIN